MSPVLHICPGPSVRTPLGEREVKWCFKCRQHTTHEWTRFSDAEPSYYEPIDIPICERCGEDHTRFPGHA